MIRKAFTLVELLIVIVVIGVLAAMMMLSSTEAVTTAKASNIVANLNHLRKAVIAWYCDNAERIKYEGDKFYFDNVKYNSIQDAIVGKTTANFRKSGEYVSNGISITNYLDGLNTANSKARNGVGVSEKIGETVEVDEAWNYMDDGSYGVNDAGKNAKRSTWFVGYRFSANENAVKEKLKGRAKSLGLFFAMNRPNHGTILNGDVQKAKTVWIKVFGDAAANGRE